MQLHQKISDSRRSSNIDFLYVSAYQKYSVRVIFAPLTAVWGVVWPFLAKKAHFQEPGPPTGASLGRAPCLSGESFLTPIPPKRPPIAPTKFFSIITPMPFFCLQRGECDSSRAKIPSGGSKMPLYGCNLAKRHQLVEITTSSPSGLVALRRNGRLFFRFFWTVRNVCSTSPRDKSFGSTFPRQPGHPLEKLC